VRDLLYQWAGNRQEIDLHELASKSVCQPRLAEAPGKVQRKLAADIRLGMHMRSGGAELSHRGKVYQGSLPEPSRIVD
jgi:hypothetical protein